MAQTVCVLLDATGAARLAAIASDRSRPLKHTQRARIVLLSAERLSVQDVARRAGVSRPAVWRWQRRYAEAGVEGLLRDKTRPPGTPPHSTETVAEVLALTCSEPPGEVTHWTGRAVARAVGISLRAVQRIWDAHRLQPHRLRTFKRSRDPAFAAKVQDVVGLYMDPPAHAVVLSIDEKSQIQALERTRPDRPLAAGHPAAQTHDYTRHGTTTLFAALDVLAGTVLGRCMQRHRNGEFIRLPGRHRGRSAVRQSDPRDPRQRRHPQASEGARLARPPPALDLSLHPDLGLLAQRRRGLLLSTHAASAATRVLHRRRRSAGGHQTLHRRAQPTRQTFRLDQTRRRHPRSRQPIP